MTTPTSPVAIQSTPRADGPNWLRHARNACLRVPPLWPLQSFVAVNPFVGLTGRPFADVCGLMARVTHESMLMSADYFRQHYASGRITSRDLLNAIANNGSDISSDELLTWLEKPELDAAAVTNSLADTATAQFGGNWSQLITEEISKWCAAYFDEGQSAWRLPWKKQALFAAWRHTAIIDGTPELNGFKGFRKFVASLPEDAVGCLNKLMVLLGVPTPHAEDYLHRLLMTLPGWSSYVQYRDRDKGMHGKVEESLVDLLAIRLVFEQQLADQFASANLRDHWLKSLDQNEITLAPKIQRQLLWHSALEIGFQRDLHSQIKDAAAVTKPTPRIRPAVQSVFCIDVRSEVMRRSLEASSKEIETLGFAGFFGMPIEYVPFGQRHGTSQVPVLFTPKYRVRGHLPDATEQQEKDTRRKMQIGRRLDHSLSAFKTSAVSCFSFVEAAGVGFAWNLLKDSFQIGGKHEPKACSTCLAPNLQAPDAIEGKSPEAGIPAEDQVQLALGALKNMGLTSVFARLVMLCGHGSHTTNNPYAAGLDCGACGGHAGDTNARVAAAILNQAAVREALKDMGIHIPDDTHFIAALHNTTTDEITLFDADKVPLSHESDLFQLQLWLDEASQRCRQKRAASLGLASADKTELDTLIHQRSRDWSQVRPEWGLAGNAAFIAAPRDRTRQLDLKGRVFLHNYRHDEDTTKSTLELIMTAPMVVANWINLQYYASTVNNRLWGSGNKVMHNVVGTFGIQQGNGGDLQSGLPLQSVHNGETWMHEPLRLSVLIEAPRSDIDAVIEKHESVRQLVENGWLHLFTIEEEGRVIQKRESHGEWQLV